MELCLLALIIIQNIGTGHRCINHPPQLSGSPGFHQRVVLPPRVEITTRKGGGRTVRFVFNNDDREKIFTVFGKTHTLKPFEMKILTE